MSDDIINVDDALAMLDVIPDYDAGNGPGPCVHTFVDAAFGLLGAHWYVEEARTKFERCELRRAGGMASGMGHGLAMIDHDDQRTVFFATKVVDDA